MTFRRQRPHLYATLRTPVLAASLAAPTARTATLHFKRGNIIGGRSLFLPADDCQVIRAVR